MRIYVGPASSSAGSIFAKVRSNFGRTFPPFAGKTSVGLSGTGQRIPTRLPGVPEGFNALPVRGDIVDTAISGNGFSVRALPGHADYPGAVDFSFSNSNGVAWLAVSGRSETTVPSEVQWAYDALIREAVWGPFGSNTCELLSDCSIGGP